MGYLNVQELIDQGKWEYSYSKLSQFDECPYSFFLQRIEKDEFDMPLEGVENAYAQVGSLVHSLIDEWAKGKLTAEDLANEYVIRYPEVVTQAFPRFIKNAAQSSYDKCLDYFLNFDEFKGYKILSSEQTVHGTIANRPFIGIIDMILEREEDGHLIVLDHKSKSMSSFKSSQKKMWRQQLLYSTFVHDRYGRWPDECAFNLFKEQKIITKPFTEKDYKEAVKWAGDIMDQIESFEYFDWLTQKEKPDMFCMALCNMREHCQE